MKATTVVVVGVALVAFALLLPYLIALALAGAIVHTAGKWRRDARRRREQLWTAETLRELASGPCGPFYAGILNPRSSAWFGNGGE